MSDTHWKAGDHVAHRQFGVGLVQKVDGDTVTVQFAAGKAKRIRAGFLLDLTAIPPDPATHGWPWDTFDYDESDEMPHDSASRWSPFVDDVKLILKRLPEIIAAATVQGGYSSIESGQPPRKVPAGWAQGFQLCWPDARRGISVVVKVSDEGSFVVSLFPFTQYGGQTLLRIEQVTVWESGMTAQISATWGEAEVTFFDTRYVIDRAHYVKGWHYEFILSGLAWRARPAVRQEMPFPLSSGAIANFNRHLAEDMRLEEGATMSLEGSAWLLPDDVLDRGEYRFRGPVKQVEAFSDWLGQDGWRVRVTVMRFGSGDAMKDADLDIHITRRAWSGPQAPQVGQDIEGLLWLQGYLWMPTSPL